VSYDPAPCYPVSDGEVEVGYPALVRDGVRHGAHVVAVDGPPTVEWEEAVAGLRAACAAESLDPEVVDMRRHAVPWSEVERRTADAEIPGDPVFARLPAGTVAHFYDELPTPQGTRDVTFVVGPGAALVAYDLLWWADLPKSTGLARIRRGEAPNLGQEPGLIGTEQRLLYVDWPLLDRHRSSLAAKLDRVIDLGEPARPRSLEGRALRATLHTLAGHPFRTRPTFLPGPWGGQWLRGRLGVLTDEPNLAWSYELITPESGILLGDGETMEVAFDLLLAHEAERVLGARVAERFGQSFPIRFDYLDTMEGGHLSLQCHPTQSYAREIFGLEYTQDETYYMMATTPGASVFLGLLENAELDAFRADTERAERSGVALDAERYVASQPAERHRLYLIPAGTLHASGAGNVVLEISATPYLYTLRFYDWLRRNLDGTLRPVHIGHAFANLDPSRRGRRVSELTPTPRPLREGPGWAELELGRHPDLFFAVHRLEFDEAIEDDTADCFHVLNLVEGEEVEIETEAGAVHRLAYAETIIVPAAARTYSVRRLAGSRCKLIKAFVA
jgi:mannose-6-phosphate isomerase class I